MNIGDLRQPLTLYEPTTTERPTGGYDIEWSDITVWASVKPIAGGERLFGGQIVSDATHRITIRYRPSVTPQWEVKLGTRKMSILSIRNLDNRSRWLELMCKEENISHGT